MMKIVTLIGARPQIIKASALSRAIRDYSQDVQEVIVHSGQHYDANMSEVFFKELNIPAPKYNLKVGSGSHAKQTGEIMIALEKVLIDEKPDCLVIYGDTNSTLAGAICACKIHIPIVHIEAGLRSFDKAMPEEINRVLADHVSTLLFCPTQTAYDNLIREGFPKTLSNKPTYDHPNVYHCGDIMYDNTSFFKQQALSDNSFKDKYPKDFILCTIHRNANTDDKQNINNIFLSLLDISEHNNIILPLHPRTKKMMFQLLDQSLLKQITNNKRISLIEPVSFLEMIYLESTCKLIITDSGGVQKEAYFLKKPSIIIRPETEWVEIIRTGNATLTDTTPQSIISQTQAFLLNPPTTYPNIFGDGHAAQFILQTMLKTFIGVQ